MNTETLQRLIRKLQNVSEDGRWASAKFLGESGDPRAVKALVSALGDRDPAIRRAAGEALDAARVRIHSFIRALKDPDEDVRLEAANALGLLGDASAIVALIYALQDWNKNVRQSVATALDKLDPQWPTTHAAKTLIPVFIDAMSSLDEDVCGAATEALDRILPQWTACEAVRNQVPHFITGLGNQYVGIRNASAELLARVGDVRAVEALVSTLEDPDEGVRKAAAKALGHIGHTHAIEALVRVLRDPNSRVRQAVTAALERIDPLWPTREVALAQVPKLIDALDDEDEAVRQVAAGVLGYWSFDGGAGTSRTCTVGVLGECSVGKSSLVHLLLGGRFWRNRGKLPSTTLPILFRYGPLEMVRLTRASGVASIVPIEMMERHFQHRDSCVMADGIEIFLPIESLQKRELLDTTGFNSTRKDRDVNQTRTAIQQCQVLIWCTPAAAAWKRTEAGEWKRILQASPNLRRHSMLLITWGSSDDRETERSLVQRVRRQAKDLFARIEIADLNEAREARPADCIEDEEMWEECGFARVEGTIRELVALSREPMIDALLAECKAVMRELGARSRESTRRPSAIRQNQEGSGGDG